MLRVFSLCCGSIPAARLLPRREEDPDLIAGAAGVALCLGADFVKVNPPQANVEGRDLCRGSCYRFQALLAAPGSGSALAVPRQTLTYSLPNFYDQIHIGGACGNATGRNIHMRSTEEAIRLCNAISAITLGDWSVEDAEAVFRGEKNFAL